MRRPRILLIEDEPGIRFGIKAFLGDSGFLVAEAATVREALGSAPAFAPDLALMDFRLPDGDALQMIPKLRALNPALPIVIITGHGTVELAVQAMQQGADHVYTKPVELPALLAHIQRLLEQRRLERKQRAQDRSRRPRNPFLGTSALIRGLEAQARRVAQSGSSVLLLGETGTGKGVLAHWLHEEGPRQGEAFVDLNCAGMPKELMDAELFGFEKGAYTGAAQAKAGLLEVAHQGTAFLDEIGDMALDLQPKLLKVLEEGKLRRLGDIKERPVDLRLVSATHQDLQALIEAGRFREDLYYRLNTVQLCVPPLRDRLDDLPAILQALLEGLAPEAGRAVPRVEPACLPVLWAHPWRGNIRELRNALERALVLGTGETLGPEDFDLHPRPSAALMVVSGPLPTHREAERRLLERALLEAKGSVPAAARLIEVPLSTLYDKLKGFGITYGNGPPKG